MTCLSAQIDRVFVVRWARPETQDLTRIQSDIAAARARLRKPLLYVAIVPADADPPEPDVRRAMIDSMGGVLEHCDAMYFAIEGTGFKHSVLRSALAGILLLAGRRGRVFVLTDAAQALQEAAHKTDASTVRLLAEARALGLLPAEAGTG